MAQLKKPYSAYAPNDPTMPSEYRTAANGWNGSRFVGLPQPVAVPSSGEEPAPSPVPGQPPVNTAPRPPAPSPTPIPGPPTSPGQPPNGNAGYYTNWGGGNTEQQQRQLQDTYGAHAPAGYDPRKWANQQNQDSHKYRAGHILSSSGSIDDVLHDPMFQGWVREGDDKIKSPQGNIYDLYYNYGGPNQHQQYTLVGGPKWDAEQNNGYQGNVGGVTGIGTPGHPGPTATDPWAGYGTGGNGAGHSTPLNDDTIKAIQDLLHGNETDQLNRRMETVTENVNRGRTSQLANMRAQMADRGLLSAPGATSGAEIGAYQNLENQIAPVYAQAIRDTLSDTYDTNQQLKLGAIGASTGHQYMLAKVALENLDQNMAWNQFLAEFGLKREQVMWEMENGNLGLIIPLIQMFAQQAASTQKGHV